MGGPLLDEYFVSSLSQLRLTRVAPVRLSLMFIQFYGTEIDISAITLLRFEGLCLNAQGTKRCWEQYGHPKHHSL